MTVLAQRIAESRRFQNFILGVIIFNAIAAGFETSEGITARYAAHLAVIEIAVQAIFVFEIAVRLAAHWPRLWRFFADGWNVFDFVIVAASLLPQAGTFAIVARLARLMRVTRIVSAFPELRLIVNTMLRSIPSMGHVIMMLSVLLYVYGILGVYLFRELDEERWGTLPTALWTLFQMLTLEGWIEVQAAVTEGAPWAWVYFASFVFIGVFVVVNLFIAVVINNLESVKVEQQTDADRGSPHRALLQNVEELQLRLGQLERALREQEVATNGQGGNAPIATAPR